MSKKALIVQGGWGGHEPKECAELWARILVEEEFEVTVADSLDIFKDADLLANLSVVTPIWTMGVIDADQFDGLSKAVAAGVGLAGWHGGMADAFREHLGYQYMVGGQFMGHPDGIKEYEVNMVATDDPITEGIEDFSVRSEQYYMHTDPGNDVLATTTFQTESNPWVNGTVMPVIWKRHWGEGRVFYSSLGHKASEFDQFEVTEIQRRGICWASGSPW